jgi:hypothetical protein
MFEKCFVFCAFDINTKRIFKNQYKYKNAKFIIISNSLIRVKNYAPEKGKGKMILKFLSVIAVFAPFQGFFSVFV